MKWRVEPRVVGQMHRLMVGALLRRVACRDDEREALLRYQRRATVSQSLAARARIVMLCAQGHTDTEVAKIVAMGADTIEELSELSRWRRRFASGLVQGREERRRPVALVLGRAPRGLPRTQRQHRLGAVQRLDLRFLVHA